jgi:hypothetical protein
MERASLWRDYMLLLVYDAGQYNCTRTSQSNDVLFRSYALANGLSNYKSMYVNFEARF